MCSTLNGSGLPYMFAPSSAALCRLAALRRTTTLAPHATPHDELERQFLLRRRIAVSSPKFVAS